MSMMEKASDNNKNSVFKMTDLRTLCKARITELGWRWLERIHTTKLKNRLLVYFESLTEFKNRKNALLVFGSAVSSALKKDTYDDDKLMFEKANDIIRKTLFQKEYTSFDGAFEQNCQKYSLSSVLV